MPTKSIIIGAGKPIVVPPNQTCSNESNLMKTMLDEKLQKITLNERKPTFPAPASTTTFKQATSSSQISSVDEFCPEDGNRLDTSFLDDPQENHSSRMMSGATAQDSDSDTEAQGNPLVARFDEDYVDAIETSSPHKTFPDTSKPKVNPLSKHRDRNSSDIEVFNIMDANRSRRSSSSSLEMKVDRNENTEFDSDSSKFLDSKVRRSPEGIEDTKTDTPASCSNASYHIDRPYPVVQVVNDSESDEKEKEKKKKHKKKSKEPKSEKKLKEKKSKKKKSKDVSTSDDDTTNVAKDAYEMI